MYAKLALVLQLLHYHLTVYFGMFHSHIIYALEVWGRAAERYFSLKKAVSLISSDGYIDQCTPIFIELGVLSLYSQYILSSQTNLKLNLNKFSTRNDQYSYSTRRNGYSDLPKCRLSKKKDCFKNLALRMYDHLLEYLKSLAFTAHKL